MKLRRIEWDTGGSIIVPSGVYEGWRQLGFSDREHSLKELGEGVFGVRQFSEDTFDYSIHPFYVVMGTES